MAYGDTLIEKKNMAYIWFANAVASESEATANHAERMNLAKAMASLAPSFDAYITVDLATQGYTDATPLNDVQNRISGLASNLVKLGFGG